MLCNIFTMAVASNWVLLEFGFFLSTRASKVISKRLLKKKKKKKNWGKRVGMPQIPLL